MSPEFLELLNKTPIHTYLLSNDTMIIGKLMASHVTSIEVRAACAIKMTVIENRVQQIFIPLVPQSIEESSIIYRDHVVLETPASLLLKKTYTDSLLAMKVNQVLQHDSNTSVDLENNQPKGNPFKDRGYN